MKHLKYFKQTSAYEAYKNGSDFITPNVSYVEDEKLVYYNPKVEDSSYVMVDLGLPSGLKWADRNVGAASPEDTGLYFQWGDTVGYTAKQIANGEKAFASDYSDYFDTTDGGSTFNKYNRNGGFRVLEASDDAATVHIGSEYRMPTKSEMEELISNCTITFIDLQGNEFSKSETKDDSAIAAKNLKGIKFTGSNGNSIFIPSSDYCSDSSLKSVFSSGSLLTSSLYSSNNGWVNSLYFDGVGSCHISDPYRHRGYPVRGVCN